MLANAILPAHTCDFLQECGSYCLTLSMPILLAGRERHRQDPHRAQPGGRGHNLVNRGRHDGCAPVHIHLLPYVGLQVMLDACVTRSAGHHASVLRQGEARAAACCSGRHTTQTRTFRRRPCLTSTMAAAATSLFWAVRRYNPNFLLVVAARQAVARPLVTVYSYPDCSTTLLRSHSAPANSADRASAPLRDVLDVMMFQSLAQIDAEGNVNVSNFPSGRSPGCGGFIDISQSAKKVGIASLCRMSDTLPSATRGALVEYQCTSFR